MTLARQLRNASVVLVVRDGNAEQWDPFPTELMEGPAEETNVVLVSGRPKMAPWLSAWTRRHGKPTGRLSSIVIGGSLKSGDQSRPRSDSRISVEAVSGPANLTDLGILVDRYVKSWANEDGETVVVHSSLTTVLQYVDLRDLFQFVVVLRACLRNANAFGVFYIDGDAHEAQTIGTLRSAFDAVVRTESGSPTVQFG